MSDANDKQQTSKTHNTDKEESLIDFPCEFPVKVMGAAIPEFHSRVHEIAKQHDADLNQEQTKIQNSKTGKYVSLTLNFHASDKAQLDALYNDLTNCELVLWAL
jgi:putative lipoic acid-binding regulatory protein